MPIRNRGWELLVSRTTVHRHGTDIRTYGSYQVYRDGVALSGLAGFMCESKGPGDNSTADNGKRIEEGRYPLSTQFGIYRSTGYSTDLQNSGAPHMPGFRLEKTNMRDAILVHPGHPPHLYLSSVGCLNPAGPLGAAQMMDFWDSRSRVIALLDSLRSYAPDAFRGETNTPIPGATITIDGEPNDAPLVAAAGPGAPSG